MHNLIQCIFGFLQGIIIVPALFIWATPGTAFMAHQISDYVSNNTVYVIMICVFALFFFVTCSDDHPMDQWYYTGATDESGCPIRTYV